MLCSTVARSAELSEPGTNTRRVAFISPNVCVMIVSSIA